MRQRITATLVAVAVTGGLLTFAPSAAHAAAGDLDVSLGGTGTIATNFQEVVLEDLRVMDTATDTAGRTLLAGYTMGGETPDMIVARLLDTGELDPSFSDDGVVYVDIGGAQDAATAVAVAPDGDIVLAGGSSIAMSAIGVARLNEDGTYDGAFGGGDGRLRVVLANATTDVGDVIFDAAGRIVIAAGYYGTNDAMWVGLDGTTGALDPSFGGDGIVLQDFGSYSERAYGLAALPAGGFVSVNQSQGYIGTIVTRHLTDGALDTTFGVAGQARLLHWWSRSTPTLLGDGTMLLSAKEFGDRAGVARLSTTTGALSTGFGTGGVASKADQYLDASGPPVELPDGRIIVAATESNQPAVIMFSALGVLDGSFGGDGMATVATAGSPVGFWETNSVAIAPGGILLTGTRPRADGAERTQGRPFLAELDLTGAAISTFATDGMATPVVTSTFYSQEDIDDLAITPGGKLAMVGTFAAAGTNQTQFAVLLANADGSPSSSFATGGVFTSDFGVYGGATADAVAAQPDGKLIVTGRVGSDALIARLTEDGQLDPTFGGGDGYVILNACPCSDITDVAVGDDGTIAAVVDNSQSNFFGLTAARFTPAGDLDSTFSGDGTASSTGNGTRVYPTGVAIDSQNRVVVSGYSSNDAAFARFATDGSLDATFGAAGGHPGEVTVPQADAYIAGVIVDPDDSLIGYGAGTSEAGTYDGVLMKLTAAGVVDGSFAEGGFSRNVNAYYEGLDVDSTGRLIAAGDIGRAFGIARYSAQGVLEDSRTVEFPGTGDYAMAVVVDSFDRATAVGSSRFRSDDVLLARLLGDTPVSSTSQATTAGTPVQSGGTPTAADPVVTAVTPSAGGVVTIVEGPTTATPPTGFKFVSQQVEITAPPGSADAPIEIIFDIDDATILAAGTTLAALGVERNGVVLPPCDTAAPLSPVPACVAGRTQHTGYGSIRVLTTATSLWIIVSPEADENHPPQATTTGPITLAEDTTVPIELTGTDSDGDALDYIVTALPAHGTLHDGGTTSAHAITAAEATSGYLLAGDTVTFQPTANYNGGDAFSYEVNDGQVDSPPATVSLVVTAVTDPTTTTYTGASAGYVANKTTKVVLSARLTSTDPSCLPGRNVTFTFDKNPTNGVAGAFTVGTAVSGATGAANLSVSTATWKPGTYRVTVMTSAREGCSNPPSQPATLILQAQKVKGK